MQFRIYRLCLSFNQDGLLYFEEFYFEDDKFKEYTTLDKCINYCELNTSQIITRTMLKLVFFQSSLNNVFETKSNLNIL